MLTHQTFLCLIDQYKAAAKIESDGALSSRMFNDGKKITALRDGGDITLKRLLAGVAWLSENWPEGTEKPESLDQNDGAAA